METRTLPQNGKASKAGTTANGANNGKGTLAIQSEQKTAQLTDKPVSIAPETTEPKALSVEDKIKKVETLNELIEKRSLLKSHLDRVEKLKFEDYQEKDAISITGSSSQSYLIKSTVLCKKIAVMLKEEITAKIVEVETQINF